MRFGVETEVNGLLIPTVISAAQVLLCFNWALFNSIRKPAVKNSLKTSGVVIITNIVSDQSQL